MCVVDFAPLGFLWELIFFSCRLPSWITTNPTKRRWTCAGWSGHVWLKQISNNLLCIPSHSHQHSRITKKDVTRSASTPPPGDRPAAGWGETSVSLWVTGLGFVIYQHFVSAGGALSSADPIVFSLSAPFKHVPRAFYGTVESLQKKGLICPFHLQHTHLLVLYMQAKRDPNYCVVLMKISFPRIYSGELHLCCDVCLFLFIYKHSQGT